MRRPRRRPPWRLRRRPGRRWRRWRARSDHWAAGRWVCRAGGRRCLRCRSRRRRRARGLRCRASCGVCVGVGGWIAWMRADLATWIRSTTTSYRWCVVRRGDVFFVSFYCDFQFRTEDYLLTRDRWLQREGVAASQQSRANFCSGLL